MKTSNILLSAIGLLIVSVLVISNLSLKAEYERGDFRDMFYQYETMPLGEVKELIIDAPTGTRFGIHRFDTARLGYPEKWSEHVSVTNQQGVLTLTVNEKIMNRGEEIYLQLPSLPPTQLRDGPVVTFYGFQQEYLAIRLNNVARASLRRMQLDTLKITGSNTSYSAVVDCDTISFADLTLTEKAKVDIAATLIDSIETQLDHQTRVEFEGSAFNAFLENVQ